MTEVCFFLSFFLSSFVCFSSPHFSFIYLSIHSPHFFTLSQQKAQTGNNQIEAVAVDQKLAKAENTTILPRYRLCAFFRRGKMGKFLV